MSFRLRLTVFYAAILTGFFLCFALFSYFIAQQTLLNVLDNNLEETTLRVVNSTNAFRNGDITLLRFPEDMGVFQTGTMFMMAVDKQGNILTRTPNLEGFPGLLDSEGYNAVDPVYATVIYSGQRLRVLTYPLLVERESEGAPEIIGYLQMAELMNNYYRALDQLGAILMIIGGVVFLFFLALGARTTHSVLQPLADMTAVSLQITNADDLSRRLPDPDRNDEIGQLTLALNKTFERLEKQFRAQQRLLADVSHELRTPLTTVRGHLDLMRQMGETDPESLDIMQDELERMSRLVGDLLLLARADGGSTPLRWQTLELDTIFLDAFKQMKPLALAGETQLIIEDLTPIRIQGDSDKIRQILLILLDNAVKYTPPGGIINMSLIRQGNEAILSIQDSGPGIPPDHLPHIFDRFYRVDKARSRAMGGSGLGLSIAKWVAEAHRGSIQVNSKMNKGTTFTVKLPAMSETFQITPPPAKPAANGRGRRLPFPNLRSSTFSFRDDNSGE